VSHASRTSTFGSMPPLKKQWSRSIEGRNSFGIRKASTFKTAYEEHVSERAKQVVIGSNFHGFKFLWFKISFLFYPGCRCKAYRCQAVCRAGQVAGKPAERRRGMVKHLINRKYERIDWSPFH
jgi:hypothetical protein